MAPGAEAWHEAGHAVAALVYGGEVRLVTLESELEGHAGHVEVAWHQPESPSRARRLAAVALAGPIAELVHLGEDALDDPRALSSWSGDWSEAEASLGAAVKSEADRDALRRELVREVRALFEDPQVYERTARVADALDAHGTLDELLLEEALG